MKIAIIEDIDRKNQIRDLASEYSWDVEFFKNPRDFGYADLSSYDVVITDCHLSTMTGHELIRSLQGKTSAQMFLMSDSSSVFSQEDIENESIKGFIEKGSPESLIDHLKYIDSKIRISRLMELESEKLNGILANGHTYMVQGTTGVLEIRELLSTESMSKIVEEIKDSEVKKVVISFNGVSMVTSAHLGILVSIYKSIKKFNCRMVFWTENLHVEKVMRECNLDNLYGIYSSLEGALQG